MSFSMSITSSMKGILSTDAKPCSRDPNIPEELNKEKGVLILAAQNQEPGGTIMIFGENTEEEHPYELPSTRYVVLISA